MKSMSITMNQPGEKSEPSEEFWYRFEDQRYAPSLNEFDEAVGRGSLKIHLYTYLVLKHTPKGVWINASPRFSFGHKKFVLKDARRRFACPTKEEALESFFARKKRQIGILRTRADDAEEALLKAKKDWGTGLTRDEEMRYLGLKYR